MKKEDILKNVVNLTVPQLHNYITEGKVTLQELRDTGNLEALKRKKIENLQIDLEKEDDNAWGKAEFGNESGLRDYISNFPTGKHIEEAKNKIRYLIQEREKANEAKNRILKNLQRNFNAYPYDQVKNYLSGGVLTEEDLIDSNIPDHVIKHMEDMEIPDLVLGDTPSSIPNGYTEVYFWGVPGSGKTCALAGILSTAEKRGLLNIATGPGYDYTTKLKNIFINGTSTLPAPSPVESTQYLPFTLKNGDEKHSRSISLIELSGEIFQCFYYKNANKQFISQSHIDTFDTLMNYLNGGNRKIHFFFIDYDQKNKVDAFGYTQGNYLSAASTFFKNNNIFGKSTDAIYVVLTKSDLMPVEKEKRVEHAKQHLKNNNFLSFVNTLKGNCREYSINAGRLTVEPFTLGEVYFKNICDFDNGSANRIIELLMERIKPSKKSLLDVFNQ